MKSRPFTYNNGDQIPGTEKFGDLTVGIPTNGYQSTNLQWWNGPDEDLGYVVSKLNVDENGNGLQPTPIEGVFGNVGFNRTKTWLYSEFLNLVNSEFGQNFTNPADAKVWLESNSKWTSFIDNLQNSFRNRVLTDGGEFEFFSCLESQINDLINKDLLDSASFVLTPNGYKENLLYAVKPDKVGTNLLLRSEEFENSYWNKTRCTISTNQEIAPNGTLTADYIVSDNTTGLRYVGVIGVPTSIGQTWTFSIFLKKKDRSVIGFQVNEGGVIFPTARFNFDTKTFIQLTSNLSASYQEYPDNWFRLIFTRTPTTGTSTVFGIYPTDQNGDLSGLGDGSRTIMWGAQLELGSTATDYISTTDRAIVNGTIGDLTVTRATLGTRVNADGDIEQVPYNLLQQSEGFTQAAWVLLGSPNVTRTSNAGTSPIGTNNATLLTSNSTSTFGIRQSVTISPNTQYVFSCWVRSDNPTEIRVDISDLNVTSFNLNHTWQRIQVLGTYNNSYAANLQFVDIVFGPNQLGSSFFIWGAQLELGSTAKDYFPTTNRFNIPRIDYSNGSCPSILVEPQRTNLVIQSENLIVSPWIYQNGNGVSTNDLNPAGQNSSNRINLLLSGFSSVRQVIPSLNNTTYTISCFFKKIPGFDNSFQMRYTNELTVPNNFNAIAFINPNTKTATFSLSGTDGTGISGSITGKVDLYPNDWFRVSMRFTSGSSSANVNALFRPVILVNSTASVLTWGAQLEVGANATSYIPTVASTVTRNADVISNTNISTLIGQTEGVIYVQTSRQVITSTGGWIFRIDNNTENNRLGIFSLANTGNLVVNIARNGVSVDIITYSNFLSLTNQGNAKIALAYKDGDFALAVNGTIVGTSSNSGTIPFMNSCRSSTISGGLMPNQSINCISLFKTRLTNSQLQQLTTL